MSKFCTVAVILAVFTVLAVCASASAESADVPVKPRALVIVQDIGYSHTMFQCKLANWLAQSGYDVDCLFTKFVPGEVVSCGPRINRVFVRDFSYIPQTASFEGNPATKMTLDDLVTIHKNVIQVYLNMTSDQGLMRVLTEQHYDVGVTEHMSLAPTALFDRIGVKVVALTSATPFDPKSLGIPVLRSFTPPVNDAYLSGDELTFFERFKTLFFSIYETFYHEAALRQLDLDMVRRLYPEDDPFLKETQLRGQAKLYVSNTHLLLNFINPTVSNLIHVGGASPGPIDLSRVDDSLFNLLADPATKDVVYVSFGTLANAASFPPVFSRSLVSLFKAYPNTTFVVKSSSNNTVSSLPNVHRFGWIHQEFVLSHPKTRLFYTHGGLNSFNEAAARGVPIILTPLFGDQFYTAALAKKHFIGVPLTFEDMATPGAMLAAFQQVLFNPIYRENSKSMAAKIRRSPLNGQEQFLKWTDFIINHRDFDGFRPVSSKMTLLQLYFVDVVLSILLSIFLAVYVVQKIHRAVTKHLFLHVFAEQKTHSD